MLEQHKNSIACRTAGAIALCPMGNVQGSNYFLNLNSGKRIIRSKWMVLSMPAEVIYTVHQLDSECKKLSGWYTTKHYRSTKPLMLQGKSHEWKPNKQKKPLEQMSITRQLQE